MKAIPFLKHFRAAADREIVSCRRSFGPRRASAAIVWGKSTMWPKVYIFAFLACVFLADQVQAAPPLLSDMDTEVQITSAGKLTYTCFTPTNPLQTFSGEKKLFVCPASESPYKLPSDAVYLELGENCNHVPVLLGTFASGNVVVFRVFAWREGFFGDSIKLCFTNMTVRDPEGQGAISMLEMRREGTPSCDHPLTLQAGYELSMQTAVQPLPSLKGATCSFAFDPADFQTNSKLRK